MGTLISCSRALVHRDFSEQQRLTSQFRGIQPQPFRIVAFTNSHDNQLEDTSTHPLLLSVASGIEIAERSRLSNVDKLGPRKQIFSRSHRLNGWARRQCYLVTELGHTKSKQLARTPHGSNFLTIQLAAADVV